MRRPSSFAAVGAATLGLAAAAVTGAGAATSASLVVNPGAEAGTGGDLPGWDTTPGFIAERYGDDQRPSAAVSAEFGGGRYAFAGGSEANTSSGTQVVDVAPSAAEIDAGAVSAGLSAYLGGVDNEGDSAKVTAAFLPAAGESAIGPPLTVGPVSAADRGNQTRLLLRSTSGKVPSGTRRIRITIISTRVSGIYTDGYADNLSLVLDGVPFATPSPSPSPSPTPSPTTTPAPTSTPAPPRPRVKGKVKGIKTPGRRVKGRVSVHGACKAGRRVVIKKGSKTVGSGRTKSNGSFSIKTKKHKKGKLTVMVRTKTTAGANCGANTKTVPGRN